MAIPKRCKRCGKQPVVRGYRFCHDCKDAIWHAMQNSGYLTPRPSHPRWRGPGAWEDRHETKYGVD